MLSSSVMHLEKSFKKHIIIIIIGMTSTCYKEKYFKGMDVIYLENCLKIHVIKMIIRVLRECYFNKSVI